MDPCDMISLITDHMTKGQRVETTISYAHLYLCSIVCELEVVTKYTYTYIVANSMVNDGDALQIIVL